jgi:hypothetical protein
MIKMLEVLCAIPEEIGWVIVGAVGMLTVMVGWKVGKSIFTAIKDRLTDDEEECEE